MLCSVEIEGYLRESDHGAREGVQDKWLLAPLGHGMASRDWQTHENQV